MLLELITAILVVLILLYLIAQYLVWCQKQYLLSTPENSTLLVPKTISDSYGPIRFAIIYNSLKSFKTDLSTTLP